MQNNRIIGIFDESAPYGAALVSDDTRIIVAEEIIYRFLGTSYSILISEYIHTEFREDFIAWFEKINTKHSYIVTKCKRYDGIYVDISMCAYTKNISDTDYKYIEFFDINRMTKNYKYCFKEKLIITGTLAVCDDIFYVFDKKTNRVTFYRCGEVLLSTNIENLYKTVSEQTIIPKHEISRLELICAAVSESNCGGTYCILTNLFGKENYLPSYINFDPIDSNAQTEYTAGCISFKPRLNAADYDPLTGLLNKKAIRNYGISAIKKALELGKSLYFIIVDLDNFKKVNDNYGHLCGDKTIMNTARIMKSIVGRKGEVGRIGGDEFLIIISDIGETAVDNVPFLRSLRSNIEFAFQNKFGEIKVTCSVGASKFPRDADNFDDMYLLADYCLYKAKMNGRNRFVVYHPPTLPSLSEIKSSGIIGYMSGIVSDKDKHTHLLSVISRINETDENKEKLLCDIFQEILSYYDIDSIQYISLSENEIISKYPQNIDGNSKTLINLIKKYNAELAANVCIAFGKSENASLNYPELAEYTEKYRFNSFMLIADNDENDNINGSFVIFTQNRYKNWSDYERRLFPILCKILTKLIVKRKK